MYSTNQATMLQTFLIWNRLVHLLCKRTKNAISAIRFSWLSTRQRYDAMLDNYSFGEIGFPQTNIKNASLLGEILFIAVIIFFVGSLIGPTANATTGITIPHTGFTVNPNVTNSPGLVPLTQLLPFLLVAVAFIGAFTLFEKHSGQF